MINIKNLKIIFVLLGFFYCLTAADELGKKNIFDYLIKKVEFSPNHPNPESSWKLNISLCPGEGGCIIVNNDTEKKHKIKKENNNISFIDIYGADVNDDDPSMYSYTGEPISKYMESHPTFLETLFLKYFFIKKKNGAYILNIEKFTQENVNIFYANLGIVSTKNINPLILRIANKKNDWVSITFPSLTKFVSTKENSKHLNELLLDKESQDQEKSKMEDEILPGEESEVKSTSELDELLFG